MPEQPEVVDAAVAALARTLIGGRSLVDSLREVLTVAIEATGAAGGTVALVGDRRVAVTYPEQLEPLAERSGAPGGPLHRALQRGEVVIAAPPVAVAASPAAPGVERVVAVPLVAADAVTGALEVYLDGTGADDGSNRLCTLAEPAAVVVANARAYHQAATKADNLQQALVSRAVIDYAVGILMSGTRCNPDEAFQMLVRASQRQNRKVRDIAAEIVERAQLRRPPGDASLI